MKNKEIFVIKQKCVSSISVGYEKNSFEVSFEDKELDVISDSNKEGVCYTMFGSLSEEDINDIVNTSDEDFELGLDLLRKLREEIIKARKDVSESNN